ncbi:uncharacterized protein VTP21DRAFT_8273 [Calcarisporiella thermophila]|uniref:uncharacterized protein n=1 Tax=Calcarisporiella thermophila TaxID=911321 RepID=UPI00374317E5
MEEQFAKIRTQLNSGLENQKQIAATLVGIEEMLREKGVELSPTAYFAAMMTTLAEQDFDVDNIITSSILYLLAIVFPNLSQPVLRSRFTELVSILIKALEKEQSEAAVVRSATACLEVLLIAQDSSTWNQPTTKKAFQALLLLSVDPRPKPRKRAHDAIRQILATPPPPTAQHPAAPMTADFFLKVLQEVSKKDPQSALHALALLKTVVEAWPTSHLAQLSETLLRLPKLNSPFLTMAAFGVFEAMFSEKVEWEAQKLAIALSAVRDLCPSSQDVQLMPAWLEVIGRGYPSYARHDPQTVAKEIPALYTQIFQNFLGENETINKATAKCLIALAGCITDEMIANIDEVVASQSKKEKGKKSKKTPSKGSEGLVEMVGLVEQGLSFRYRDAWGSILVVIPSLFERLGRTSLLAGVLALMDELRTPEFPHKTELEQAIGSAIQYMGPRRTLEVLPLNIENPGEKNQVGRAWLLPLLNDNVQNTELAYFVEELIPLADRLATKAEHFANEGRAIEAKVYETLEAQIWGLLPGFCTYTTDLPSAFTKVLGERVSNALYQKPELRAALCQALQLLVEKHRELVNSKLEDAEIQRRYHITRQEAENGLKHLSKLATNLLAVFFNVFSQSLPTYRGFVLEVIRVYLSITSEQEINATFKKVASLLQQALSAHTPAPANDPTALPPVAHTMLDLATGMAMHLDSDSLESLYEQVVPLLAQEEDSVLQKKAYKALNKIAESERGREVLLKRIEDWQAKLLDATMNATPSARKERLITLTHCVKLLPSEDLHLIPSILSEAVVSTKEVNERARLLAYDLLIQMGEKMRAGGTVVQSKVVDMDENMPDTAATIREYFMMVTAGLAGSTPHMISATIASLSRLLFEFKDDMEPSLIDELLQTMQLFIESNNREIVKAALGFVKVSTVSLPVEAVRPHLPQLVTGLLKWSHEHKSHFKVKVRHIFERLIRRFGYEAIDREIPESDRKLIVNIRKRRERAKRKKSQAMEMDEGDASNDEDERMESRQVGKTFNSAYEDALYGSESEIESDEEITHQPPAPKGKKQGLKGEKLQKGGKNKGGDAFIREGEDEPLDFLDRNVVSRVMANKPSSQKNMKKNSDGFVESGDGRLVIRDEDEEGEASTGAVMEDDAEAQAEGHYLEAVRSADGFTRGQGNRVKFNKRRRNDDDMNIDEDREDGKRRKKAGGKGKEQNEVLGKEYKAKHAAGDVKKKGRPDPYAYVPLGKVMPRKGQKKSNISFVGGKKKRN